MKASGLVAQRVVAVLVAALVAAVAGWWLLREPSRAPVDAVVLQRADAQQTAGTEAPGFSAPVPAANATPIALHVDASASGDAGAENSAMTAAGAVQLVVVHASGTPATGATVVLVRAGASLGSGLTDAAGRVRLELSAGGADGRGGDLAALVGGVSDVPQRVKLKAGSGEQRVLLPDGLRVEGQVFVDDAPLREPLLLGLQALPRQRKSNVPESELLSALYIVAPGQAQGQQFNAQVVAPGGHFEFSCLPEGWNGRFKLSNAFECVNGEDGLKVRAPALALRLHLRSSPTVRGRVLEPGVSVAVAVPGAGVACHLEKEHGQNSFSFACDAEGRFAIPITAGDGALKALSLKLTHPEGRGYLELDVSPEDIDRNPDLGDLHLLPARPPLHLLVRDGDGAPLPGAIAKADDGFAARSTKTDDDGRGVLRGVPPETPTMTVWAHRFFSRTVTLPDAGAVTDEQHPLVVVMERCPSLDVIVKGADGQAPRGLRVALQGDQAIFASSEVMNSQQYRSFTPDSMAYEVGMTESSGSSFKADTSDGFRFVSGSALFTPDAAGRVTLSNLVPDVPFDVLVQDEADNPAWGPQTLSLQPGEARVMEATVAHDATDLLVHVTDTQGAPLERAYVGVINKGKDGDSRSSSSTNADGLVTLKRIFADTVSLSADKDGYVTRQLDNVAVLRDAPLEVVLQPGLQVRVFVHDTQGRPVLADNVRALLELAHVGSANPDDGTVDAATKARAAQPATSGGSGPKSPAGHARWLVFDLPLGDLTFEASVGGRRFTTRQSSAVPDADIVVPDVGALFVHCGFALDPKLDYTLVLTPVGGSADVVVKHWLNATERANGEVRFPTLVPGSYDLSLTTWAKGAQVQCAKPATVEVKAGNTPVVQLEEP